MKKSVFWGTVGLMGVVVAAVLVFTNVHEAPAERPTEDGAKKVARQAKRALLRQKGGRNVVKPIPPARKRLPAIVDRKTSSGNSLKAFSGRLGGESDGIFRDEKGTAYPAAEQKLMRAAQSVIERDDLEGARALAATALTSRNVELRGMVVDALGWFGQDAIAELLPFLSDRNETVAENARGQWMMGLQEIEDDGAKAGVVQLTLEGLKDKDVIEDVVNELIGIDELAAMQVLVNVINGENPVAAEMAKETYNTLTGDDWFDVDAAEEWLQQNYEPPEENLP